MIEILNATFAAGETKTFQINGQYLEVLDAQYAVDIYLLDKHGAQLSAMRSAEASFFSRPAGGFQSVQVYSAQAQPARFFIGSGDAGTRRISSTVSVIDGSRARTNAGVAFAGDVGVPAVADKWDTMELWNPVGSGRRLIVNQVSVSTTAAAAIGYLVPSNAALATDESARISCKRLYQPNGVGKLMRDYYSVAPVYAKVLAAMNCSQSLKPYWTPTEPIVLDPGCGLLVVADQVNIQMNADFEWFEEVI